MMGDAKFTFDGVLGSYISTEDINLLDADTAHIHQSIGSWRDLSAAVNIQQSTALTPVFGDFHLECTTTNNADVSIGSGGVATGGRVAVSPSTLYTFAASAATDTVRDEIILRARWYDVSDVLISSGPVVEKNLAAADAWEHFVGEVTSPSNAVTAEVQFKYVGMLIGDFMYADAWMIAEGSYSAFVPSLRVISGYEWEQDLNHVTWTHAALTYMVSRNQIFGHYFNTTPNWITFLTDDVLGTDFPNVSPQPVLVAGERYKFKSEIDLDGGDVTHYVDDVQQGSPIATSITELNEGTAVLYVGTQAVGWATTWEGDMFSMTLRDGPGGPIVAKVNPVDYTGGVGPITDNTDFTDSVTGRVWTTHGGISFFPDPGSFFTLDGIAGTYFATDDINRLDADTAHMEQDLGDWISFGGATGLGQSTAMVPSFGSSHGECTTVSSQSGVQNSSLTFPASPGIAYKAIVDIAAADASEAGISIIYRESDGTLITQLGVQNTAIGPDGWTTVVRDGGVAPALTAFIQLRVLKSGLFDATTMYWDSACIRTDGGEIFIPSLRVVGDSHDEIDVSADWPANSIQPIGGSVLTVAPATYYSGGTNAIRFAYRTGAANYFDAGKDPSLVAFERVLLEVQRVESTGVIEYFKNGVSLGTSAVGPSGPIEYTIGQSRWGDNSLGLSDFIGHDVYSLTRRDGIDGPIVARVLVSNYLGADGTIPPTTEFIDSATGRTWIVIGGIEFTGSGGKTLTQFQRTGYIDATGLSATFSKGK